MDNVNFYELKVRGRTIRTISIHGLRRLRMELGLSPVPKPEPEEDLEAYKKRLVILRKETLRLATPELLEHLFGPEGRGLI